MANRQKPDPLLGIDDVIRILNVSRATLYRWIDSGTFPAALVLSPQVRRWRRSTVMEWISEKEVSSSIT